MFRWYQGSEVCYAYLHDILESPPRVSPGWDTWIKEEFVKARWLTRGWTLHEMIAPRRLKFFARDWVAAGSKFELLIPISKSDKRAQTGPQWELAQARINVGV